MSSDKDFETHPRGTSLKLVNLEAKNEILQESLDLLMDIFNFTEEDVAKLRLANERIMEALG